MKRQYFENWKIDDVIDWLKDIGLNEYCEIFEDQFIDGKQLSEVNRNFLMNELRMTKSDAKMILKELRKLQVNED